MYELKVGRELIFLYPTHPIQSCYIHGPIIIIHEFHRDASLETKLQGRYRNPLTDTVNVCIVFAVPGRKSSNSNRVRFRQGALIWRSRRKQLGAAAEAH